MIKKVFEKLSLYYSEYSVLKNSKNLNIDKLSLLRENLGVSLLQNIGRKIIRCNTLAVYL